MTANNEIGVGRDISASIPGGFSSAGSLTGNLRTRSAAVFLNGALGTLTQETAVTGPPAFSAYDEYSLADLLPYFTIEKKVGSNQLSAYQQLVVQYTDCVINTLNITVPSAAFATFSAGVIACGESYQSSEIVNVENTQYSSTFLAGYDPKSDDILAFYGGQIVTGQSSNTTTPTLTEDDTFQSFEITINNNVQSDEYTVRPSRFLRSVTEGIRAIDCNITQVFTDYRDYQQYTYGNYAYGGSPGTGAGYTTPGYQLYMGSVLFTITNWQLDAYVQGTSDVLTTAAPTGGPQSPDIPQGLQFTMPKVAFSGFPVTLSTGRIVVTTTAVALRPNNPTTGWNSTLAVQSVPQGAGFAS